MAKDEKKPEKQPAEKAPAEAAPKKKGSMKLMGTVGAIVVAQAVITFVAFSAMGPKKSHAQVDTHEMKKDDSDVIKEIVVIPAKDGSFQNTMTGSVWQWSAEIVVQVKQRNAEAVENKLKQRSAEVKQEISQIFSRAQHSHLKEPDRQTLNRQITGMLNKFFGNDDKGEPVIERVLIPMCRGFPMPS
ncbi:MAG: hypothetical protein IBJ18_06305 [Phycisphaerales bacterium]|nr:hypothetical protein [Phycisphaerales bacterium]